MSLFRTSQPSLLLDYFRVPHAPGGASAASGLAVATAPNGRRFAWVAPAEGAAAELHDLDGIPVWCAPAGEDELAGWQRELGGEWQAAHALRREPGGDVVASLSASDRGDVLIPFDPDTAMLGLWSEAYARAAPSRAARVKRLAMRGYYRARPFIPRPAQIWLRRRFSRIQARTRFPRWPVEPALHDLYDLLLGLLATVAGEPVPTIAPWPDGRSWALVLTHDVELQGGHDNVDVMRRREEAAGFRSSWNFVPKRYRVDEAVVTGLTEAGFEVGVHGLYHDGRDLESRELLEQRLPEMRSAAEAWGAVGFRSPATHRDWELMPLLGFDYDSSSPDTDPFEPQSGGCCTWLPFQNGRLVELPITLVQDHTLFVILDRGDEAPWVEKADFLRERGGLACLITHPDYMLDEGRLAAYDRFLARYADDATAWRALPREVAAWWRERSELELVRDGESWSVTGPAARRARVAFVVPP